MIPLSLQQNKIIKKHKIRNEKDEFYEKLDFVNDYHIKEALVVKDRDLYYKEIINKKYKVKNEKQQKKGSSNELDYKKFKYSDKHILKDKESEYETQQDDFYKTKLSLEDYKDNLNYKSFYKVTFWEIMNDYKDFVSNFESNYDYIKELNNSKKSKKSNNLLDKNIFITQDFYKQILNKITDKPIANEKESFQSFNNNILKLDLSLKSINDSESIIENSDILIDSNLMNIIQNSFIEQINKEVTENIKDNNEIFIPARIENKVLEYTKINMIHKDSLIFNDYYKNINLLQQNLSNNDSESNESSLIFEENNVNIVDESKAKTNLITISNVNSRKNTKYTNSPLKENKSPLKKK